LSEPEAFDLARIASTFGEYGVDWVLIGGAAAQLYLHEGATRDVDSLIRGSLENGQRVANALNALGARLPDGTPRPGGVSADDVIRYNTAWMTDAGAIDLLIAAAGPEGTSLTYGDVEPTAVWLRGPNGIGVRVVSVPNLIAMKRAAGRPRDIVTADLLENVDQPGGSRHL